MRVFRIEYKVADLDPLLTEDEIANLPKLTYFYKYYGDQLLFREISPLPETIIPYLHSQPLNGTLRYNMRGLVPPPLSLSRLNDSCQLNHCATSLSPRESAYIFLYHPGDTGNLTETFILSFQAGSWLAMSATAVLLFGLVLM